MQWSGNLNGTSFPVGSTISVHYDFTINQTASSGSVGTATWNLGDFVDNAPSLFTTGGVAGASNHYTGTLSETLTSPLTSNTWTTNLNIFWNGEDPSASMTISVPAASSIDLSVVAPEPASLSVLGFAGAALLARRRRA